MKKFNLKKKIKDGQIHDLRYFKDHVVKELELFFIFKLEAGPIKRLQGPKYVPNEEDHPDNHGFILRMGCH